MPAPLAAECADDYEDLTEETATDALANLNMEDEEDAIEEEEMIAGDRGKKNLHVASVDDGEGKKKKKKRKKKKKNPSIGTVIE